MEDGELVTESFQLRNIGPGPIILGVQMQIQLDRAFEDGLLVEETYDYYAQDTDGNVWYFGEDVTNIELVQVIPLPAAAWMFGSAIGLLGFLRRRLRMN